MNKETHIVVCSLRGIDIIPPRTLWARFSSSVDSLGALKTKYREHINDICTSNILSNFISYADPSHHKYDSSVYIVETNDNELYLFIDLLQFETPEEIEFKPGVFVHMGQHFDRYLEEFQHELNINKVTI